jgi:hypothetical protein
MEKSIQRITPGAWLDCWAKYAVGLSLARSE